MLLLGPNDVEESMIRSTWTLLFPRQQAIALGIPLLDILQSCSTKPGALLKEFEREKYMIGVRSSRGSYHQVLATMRTGAESIDELKAFVHCLLLRKCLDLLNGRNSDDELDVTKKIQVTHAQLKALFGGGAISPDNNNLMQKLADLGWDVDGRLYLGFGRQRTSWETKKDD